MNPARSVVTRSPHRRVGYIPCPWLQGHHVAYESLLECRFVRIALLYPPAEMSLARRHRSGGQASAVRQQTHR